MTDKPTRATIEGRTYLDLRAKARADNRPTEEILRFYALEGFLDRLATSKSSATFVLKGGVLLVAYDLRRPTRDVDLLAENTSNDANSILMPVKEIIAE